MNNNGECPKCWNDVCTCGYMGSTQYVIDKEQERDKERKFREKEEKPKKIMSLLSNIECRKSNKGKHQKFSYEE